MKVIVQRLGFYGGRRRYEGDVLEVPEGTVSKTGWFVPLGEKDAPTKKKQGRPSPTTLSQMARAQSVSPKDALHDDEVI